MSFDPNVLRQLQSGGGGVVQAVPRDLLQQQMDKQETIQNVNIAFSICNSETIYKHAIDGSDNAKESISRALAIITVYLRDVKLNGQELFTADGEPPSDEPRTHAG